MISDTITKHTYDGDNSKYQWDFTFPILSTTDADALNEVYGYLTDTDGNITLITENYSVDVSASQFIYPIVTYPLLAKLPVGWTITIIRIEDLTQLLQLITNGGWKIEQVETALDKLTCITQQLKEWLSRCIAYPTGATPTSTQVNAQEYIVAILAAEAAALSSQVASATSAAAASASQSSAAASAVAAAQTAAEIGIKRGTFTSADLTVGILTITHNKNLTAPYQVLLEIYKPTGERLRPTCIGSANSVAVDLSLWTITSTWGYILI